MEMLFDRQFKMNVAQVEQNSGQTAYTHLLTRTALTLAVARGSQNVSCL
jgi:hypothetical protein